MNSISIVKGNEARVIVNLTRILATSAEELPLEVSEVKDLRVRLIPRCGASVSLAANVYSENSVIVIIPVLPCGTYAMEVTGERNLMRIASRELCVLRVVYDNSLATVPSGEIDGSKSYDIDMTMVLYTNEVYQVDEEVTEDGKNTPRTSAVYKTLQMYGEAAQQAAEELNVMHENISKLAVDVSDVVESEEERAKAEEERLKAEAARVQAETDRVNEFAALKSASEKATTSANSAASAANSAAAKAEAATTTANENEQARQKEEAERVKEETKRANAESERVKDETSRANAESARVQAETDRTNAWAAWFENATTGVKALWDAWFTATKQTWSDWFGATESAGVRQTWADWFKAVKNAWNEFNTTASQAESARENAENIRREQEAERVIAEQTRVNEFSTIKSDAASATASANSATASANSAAASANGAMTFVKTNQPYIGEDGYWYIYNPETKQMEKTDMLANGGMIMPSVYREANDLVIDGGIGDPTGKFVKVNNDLEINF